MKKYIFALMFLSVILISAGEAAWESNCPSSEIVYCSNIGKGAYNATGHSAVKNIELGKIVGVVWRPQGSSISSSNPSRTSPRDAYYYIIDDGGGDPFIRQCREIDSK